MAIALLQSRLHHGHPRSFGLFRQPWRPPCKKIEGPGYRMISAREKCVTTVTAQKLYLHDYVQHPPPIEALFDANEHPDERINSS